MVSAVWSTEATIPPEFRSIIPPIPTLCLPRSFFARRETSSRSSNPSTKVPPFSLFRFLISVILHSVYLPASIQPLQNLSGLIYPVNYAKLTLTKKCFIFNFVLGSANLHFLKLGYATILPFGEFGHFLIVMIKRKTTIKVYNFGPLCFSSYCFFF